MSTNQNLVQHMRELIDCIKAADVAYYRDDNPTMTDREYDLLVDELKELETTTGLILSGSPTQTVSGEILKELTPVRHTIGIYLDGVIPCQKDMKEIGSIGVDAGLAGFFHNKPDYTDDEWAAFCDRVRHGDAWLIKEGFYSSSGYGDGCYGVYAYEQGGEITAIEIRFL